MVVYGDMKKFLDSLKAFSIPDFSTIKPSELRAIMDNARYPRDVEDVGDVRAEVFNHHGVEIPMRLYVPEPPGNGLIVYLHGGGFVFGSLDMADALCRRIANASGHRVLSVDYRLAPENKFPAALEDSYEAVKWAYRNAGRIGIDADRICIAGDSAGGNLAIASALKLKDSGEKLPRLIAAFYPSVGNDSVSASQREYAEDYFLRVRDMRYFGTAYMRSPDDVLNPYFSPIAHPNLSGLPETIIVVAENDPLRDQGETFAWKLDNAGVPVTCIRANGMIHGFENFFSLSRAAANVVTMVWSLAGSILRKA
ncbi:MAG: alpha/beta hydrolase [Thermoplasmataceae archaeon]